MAGPYELTDPTQGLNPYQTGQQAYVMPQSAPPIQQMPNNTPPIAPPYQLANQGVPTVAPPYSLQGAAQSPDQQNYDFGQAYQQAYQNGNAPSPLNNRLNSPEVMDKLVTLHQRYADALNASFDEKPNKVHDLAAAIAHHSRGGPLGMIAAGIAGVTDKHEIDRAAALKGLNDTANLINLANIKPLVAAQNDYRKAQEQQIKQERNDNLKKHGEAMVQARNWATMENARHNNMINDRALESLGMKREHFDRAFQQRNDFMDRHEQTAKEMANLQAAMKMYGYRQDWAMKLAQLRHQDLNEYGKMKMEEAKLNSHVSQSFAQAAAKGQPLVGPNGQPLRPEDLMVHYERQPLELPEQTPEEGVGEAMSQVGGEPEQETVPPGRPATIGTVKLRDSQRAIYQRLIGGGMKPEEAKALYIQAAVKHGHSLEQAVEMAKGF